MQCKFTGCLVGASKSLTIYNGKYRKATAKNSKSTSSYTNKQQKRNKSWENCEGFGSPEFQLFNLCWPKALGLSLLHKAQTGEFTLNRHPLFLSQKLYQDRIRRANSVPPPRKRCFGNWWDTMMTDKVHAHSRNEKGIMADHRCPIKGTGTTTTTKKPQPPPTTSK